MIVVIVHEYQRLEGGLFQLQRVSSILLCVCSHHHPSLLQVVSRLQGQGHSEGIQRVVQVVRDMAESLQSSSGLDEDEDKENEDEELSRVVISKDEMEEEDIVVDENNHVVKVVVAEKLAPSSRKEMEINLSHVKDDEELKRKGQREIYLGWIERFNE